MKLDEIFHLDHVKAHRVIKSKDNANSIEPRWELNRNNIEGAGGKANFGQKFPSFWSLPKKVFANVCQ